MHWILTQLNLYCQQIYTSGGRRDRHVNQKDLLTERELVNDTRRGLTRPDRRLVNATRLIPWAESQIR